MEWRGANGPAIRFGRASLDGWHHRIGAFQSQLHGRFTQRKGLINVCLAGNMACSALQIIRDSPVVLVAQFFLDHACQQWRQTTELSMPKGIPLTLI